jgi:CDP-diacylglycerol---glycerol-3-phosphate 3-phosphatidyltransferase
MNSWESTTLFDIACSTASNTHKECCNSNDIAPFALHTTPEVIFDPPEYYNSVLEGIKNAQKDIILSALYLGNGPLSKAIVTELINACDKNPNLKIKLIFDHTRAQRVESDKINYHILLPLINKYPNQTIAMLFEVPQLQNHLLKPLIRQEPSLGEILGVYHAKFCLFDSNCLLSGANLSEEYFLQRQDRYMKINCNTNDYLPTFLHSFVNALEPHCHVVKKNSSNNNGIVVKPKIFPTAAAISKAIKNMKNPNDHIDANNNRIGDDNGSIGNGRGDYHNMCDSMVYPLIQFGTAGIQDEARFLPKIIQTLSKMSSLESSVSQSHSHSQFHFQIKDACVSSPYASFVQSFSQSLGILSEKVPLNIITPSNSSHGFGNASGIKAFVPLMHESAFQRALKSLKSVVPSQGHSNLKLRKYNRNDWTFHAKGLWMSLTNNYISDTDSNDASIASNSYSNSVFLSFVGSSNMGERSTKRDFELGIFIVTQDKKLCKMLEVEQKKIINYSQIQTNNPKINKGTRILARLIKSYL